MNFTKKKLIITVSILLVICLLSVITIMFYINKSKLDLAEERKFGDFYIGMTYEEFRNIVHESGYFGYLNYIFYTDTEGNYIVARFSFEHGNMGSIVQLKHFYKEDIDPTVKNFSKIQPGMTVFDVVKLVGVPHGSSTFGMNSLDFKDTNGNTYTVYLQAEGYPQNTNYIVSSVVKN